MPVALALYLLTRALPSEGPAVCPDLSAVAKELRDPRVHLERLATGIRLSLIAEGTKPLERTLAPEGTCEELGAIVSVILEAWATDFPAQPLETTPLPPLAEKAALAPEMKAPVAQTQPKANWQFELSLAGAAVVQSTGVTPAGLLTASLAPPRSPFGLELGLAIEGAQSFSIDGGRCSWQRLSLELGPRWRGTRGRFGLEVGVTTWLSRLSASGQGLAIDRTAVDLEPALGASAEGSVRLGRFEPFIGLWPVVWLRPQTVQVDVNQGSQQLPQVELLGVAGLRLRLD